MDIHKTDREHARYTPLQTEICVGCEQDSEAPSGHWSHSNSHPTPKPVPEAPQGHACCLTCTQLLRYYGSLRHWACFELTECNQGKEYSL